MSEQPTYDELVQQVATLNACIRELEEPWLAGVELGARAGNAEAKSANYRADMAARAWNQMNDLIAELSQAKIDLQQKLTATEGKLREAERERDELIFQIDVIAVADPGWKANHVMRMAKFAADGINTHWDVVAQEKEKAILATNRAKAAENKLTEAVQTLERIVYGCHEDDLDKVVRHAWSCGVARETLDRIKASDTGAGL